MNELKYKENQRVIVIEGRFKGQSGTITRIDELDPFLTYRVDFDNGAIQWYSHAMIVPDELQTLRTENERLTALVEKIYAEAKEMVFHLNTDTYQADSEVRDSMGYIEMWILHYKSGVDVQ